MRRLAIWVPLLAMSAAQPAYAGGCPEPTDEQVVARIAEVESIFDEHAPSMNLWWTGFLGLHATMAATMSVVQNYQSEDARRETAVGIVGSALGATTLFLVTPPLLERDRALGPLPKDTPEARRHYLATAEGMLAVQAKKSRFATSWLARGMAFAYTTGAALFVWLALDRPRGAIRNFVGGLVIGQGRIMLHPMGAVEAWDAYRTRHVDGCGEARRVRPVAPAPTLHLSGGPGGLGFTLRF